MHPILFKIGSLTIYTYGVFVFLGVIIGYSLSLKEAKSHHIDKDKFSNLVFWSILFSFIGARVFYIITNFKDFLQSPTEYIFSRSGFVFYGGLVFGLVSMFFYSRKYNIDFLKLLDISAFGITIGHSIGRLGCFSYGCCYGKPTNSFIGVVFPIESPVKPIGVRVIPTQLIEAFFLVVIFFILKYLKRKINFKGGLFFSYCFLYGILRFIIEFFRGDDRGYFLFFSTSQWFSIFFIFLSIFYFKKMLTKYKF